MSTACSDTTIIRSALLADGLGKAPQRDRAVLVQGGRIADVGDGPELVRTAPPDAEHIDLGEACLIPGHAAGTCGRSDGRLRHDPDPRPDRWPHSPEPGGR